MTREEMISKICEDCISMMSKSLPDMVAYTLTEGYKLGYDECAKRLGIIIERED